MAEIFKFFNSAPGDERWHYASDFADYFGSVLSSGLISNGEAVGLQATVNSGTMTTSVAIGKALIKGYSYENTTPLTLTHSIPEQTLDRIDRVVLRLDLKNASRFIRVFIKEGVSALEPIPPTLQRDQYIYELSLAQVRIRKNTSSIVVSDIKDERADENLCGIVQSLITVPTSVFQQQFDVWFASIADVTEQSVYDWQIAQQQAFTLWFESIKGQLDGDVGAKLASDLATHQADLAYQTAGGTANAITLTTATLTNGYAKTFIALANNNGSTTTINGKPLYKPNTTTAPTLIAGKAYTVWYNQPSDCFFIKASAEGTATTAQVLAGATFSNDIDTGIVGTYNPSSIKSVQSGDSAAFNNTSDLIKTVSISPVNLSKSVVLVEEYPSSITNSDVGSLMLRAEFSNNSTLKFTREIYGTYAQPNFVWRVIEFENVKSKQTGSVSVLSGNEVTVNINAINPSKSLIFFSYSSKHLGTPVTVFGIRVLINSNTLKILSAYGDKTVNWQLIEFN